MCEAIRGMVAEGRAEGHAEGRTEGQMEKAYQTAKNMYARGFSAAEAAGLLDENLETVERWYKAWKEQ